MNFVLTRILGNPLPPRHDGRNTLDNLRFVLENEAELPDCEKRWILNGIVDPELAETCRRMIESAGQACRSIPFDAEAYGNAFLDASGLPPVPPGSAVTPGQAVAPIAARLRQEWIYRHKSLAAINLNRARNLAIEDGRPDADWVLPLDGGTLFTAGHWQAFRAALEQAPDALYALIPLRRLAANEGLREMPPTHYAPEPQIAFHRDAPDRFDERLRYGNRNKAELLVRLQVPGPWHGWQSAAWEPQTPIAARAAGRFVEAGALYRLESGAHPQVEAKESQRHQARFQGVAAFTAELDARLLTARLTALGRTPWILPADDPLLSDVDDRIRRLAQGGPSAIDPREALLWPLLAESALAHGRLDDAGYADIRQRLEALLTLLERAPANRRAGLSGTRRHLLKSVLALFLRRDALASRLLHNAPLRLVAQCAAGNAVADDALSAARNAALWLLLARLAGKAGVDLAAYRGVNGESLDALLASARRRAARPGDAARLDAVWALLALMRTGADVPPGHLGLVWLMEGLPAHWPALWAQLAP